ncbi:MAG: DUF3365 domain-containing protein [Bacteroidota bacterium]|nr:DUF3365 domain-containing protein [Bacteroidota bacterium]
MKYPSVMVTAVLSGIMVMLSCTENQVSHQTNNDMEKLVSTIPSTEINYLETGKELALQTKSSLGKYLVSALSEKGAAGAIEFCTIKAIAITDSMSLVLEGKIKRVSDQPRNLMNLANVVEFAYIKKWKEAHANGEEQPPIITEVDGKTVGYYPIITNQMCLQFHGKPDKEINNATLQIIKKLYPADQAIGYAENEIRGFL